MKNKPITCWVVLCAVLSILDTHAGPAKETAEQRDARMAWWREAKFGMFVHWGVYSVTGGEYKGHELPNSAEWMMNKGKIPIAEYEQYAARFNPTNFNADAFVTLAGEAGMRYLVITAKHHDGFSMFGSKATHYNVVEATPFKRDIMKELSEACRRRGIRFGFYYSQAQDWHHPGGAGNTWDKSLKRVSGDEYVREKAYPEAKQLLTEYGPISVFWWDTPRQMSKQALDSLYSTRYLQPGLITNDRLGKGYPGDYKTFERRIPDVGPTNEDWEVCMPISGSWGYKKSDTKFKSSGQLIRDLADIASKGGNFLLNVSPTGQGTLLPQAVERLKAIGAWMKVNGEAIYGTGPTPFGAEAGAYSPTKKDKAGKPRFIRAWDWRCTTKPGKLYVMIFNWPASGRFVLPGLESKVTKAYLLAGRRQLKFNRTDADVTLDLPTSAPDKIASVVCVEIADASAKVAPEVKK